MLNRQLLRRLRFVILLATPAPWLNAQNQKPITYSDYRNQAPGIVHKITVADLPAPYASKAVDNGPSLVSRPKDAWPNAPAGFKVELYASGLENPRELRTAPNGDVFLAESDPGVIKVFRGVTKDGKAAQRNVCHGPEEALRHRLLSARSESAMDLYWEYRFRGAFSLHEWGSESARR